MIGIGFFTEAETAKASVLEQNNRNAEINTGTVTIFVQMALIAGVDLVIIIKRFFMVK